MIRETVETFGPPGILPSREAVGPEPVHEAAAIVEALRKLLRRWCKRSHARPPEDAVHCADRKGREAPLPGLVPFWHPSLKAKIPTGPGWLYEIKFDGYRCQLYLNAGRATAYSRNGYDFTRAFAPICAAAEQLDARTATIDGEVIIADGRVDFGALRWRSETIPTAYV